MINYNKKAPKTYNEVLAVLHLLVLRSDVPEKAALLDFIGKTCLELINKLVPACKFITRTDLMDDETIEAGIAACECYVAAFRNMMHIGQSHPVLGQTFWITPKMHIMEVHVPDFARYWTTVGFFGEDPVETLHKDYNQSLRTYNSVRRSSGRDAMY